MLSPAYHTRLALAKIALTLGFGESCWIAPAAVVRSSASATWLPCAFSSEKAMRLPSGLACGRIHADPLLTETTPPPGAQDCTPAVVRKDRRAPLPDHAAIGPSVRGYATLPSET